MCAQAGPGVWRASMPPWTAPGGAAGYAADAPPESSSRIRFASRRGGCPNSRAPNALTNSALVVENLIARDHVAHGAVR